MTYRLTMKTLAMINMDSLNFTFSHQLPFLQEVRRQDFYIGPHSTNYAPYPAYWSHLVIAAAPFPRVAHPITPDPGPWVEVGAPLVWGHGNALVDLVGAAGVDLGVMVGVQWVH